MGNLFSNKEELIWNINNDNKDILHKQINFGTKKITIIVNNTNYHNWLPSYNDKRSIIVDIENTNVEILDLSHDSCRLLVIEKLPHKLKSLILSELCIIEPGGGWCGFQPNVFPNNLIELTIDSYLFCDLINIIPPTLKKLKLYKLPNDIINFPQNLEILIFSETKFSADVTIVSPSNKLNKLFDNLPSTLKILKIPNNWNFPLNNLPCGLKKLFLGEKFNQLLDFLPESLTHLEFFKFNEYSQPLNNLPRGLEYLDLGYCNNYIYPIQNLPNSIKYLKIGKFNLEIKNFPDCLEKLVIGSSVYFNLKKKYNLTSGYDNFYELEHFGSYNKENNIKIPIPSGLKEIICYNYLYYPAHEHMIVVFPGNLQVNKYSNLESSVINYKRISNKNNWKLEKQTMKKLCDL